MGFHMEVGAPLSLLCLSLPVSSPAFSPHPAPRLAGRQDEFPAICLTVVSGRRREGWPQGVLMPSADAQTSGVAAASWAEPSPSLTATRRAARVGQGGGGGHSFRRTGVDILLMAGGRAEAAKPPAIFHEVGPIAVPFPR